MKLSEVLKPLALSIALCVVFGAAPSLAQDSNHTNGDGGPHHGYHHHHHHHCPQMHELNLTDAQKAQLKKMNKQMREENSALFDDMKAKYKELKSLKQNEAANSDKIKDVRKALWADKKEIWEKKKAILQSVLTPEQQTKMKSIKEQCHAEWKKDGGEHHHHHDQGTSSMNSDQPNQPAASDQEAMPSNQSDQ